MAKGKDPKKEERICQAATKIFSKKGFFDTTVKDIAREAGIAEGTIYIYFESKKNLLTHIFEKGWSQVISEVEKNIRPYQEPWEKFQVLLFTTLEFFKNDLDLAKVLIKESFPGKGGLGEKTVIREWFTFRKIVENILQEAKEKRLIPQGFSVSSLRQILHGAIEMTIYGWVVEKENEKYETGYTPQEITNIIMAMLRGLSVYTGKLEKVGIQIGIDPLSIKLAQIDLITKSGSSPKENM